MRSIFFRKTRLGLPAARSVQESVRASHQAQFTALCRLVLAAAASLLLTLGALAQEGPAPLQPGDVIVTNFSGVIDTGGGSEQDPAAGLAVDTAGNSAVILRLTDAPVVRNNTIQAAIVRSYKALEIGQVFPIARTPGTQPYIYFGATSQFGLQIVKPDPATGAFVRLKSGAPKAQWMEGQWGPGGGAGSIWQVKPDGGVRLFATVPGNSAAGIGGLTLYLVAGHLYASDLSTGLIYNFDRTGAIAGTFDHGAEARPAGGLAPIPAAPSASVDIASPDFNTEDLSTWGFAPIGRQVWALTVSQNRLYYAAGEGPAIWSVSLNPDGSFGHDPQKEFDIQSEFPNRITSMFMLSQGNDSLLYAAQRGAMAPAFDFSTFANPGEAQVLRFVRDGASGQWNPVPDTYAIGHTPEYNNAAGGVAARCPLPNAPGQPPAGLALWSTIDGLLETGDQAAAQPSADEQPQQTTLDQSLRHGLQGEDPALVRPANVPPDNAVFAIYGEDITVEIAGFMGDIKTLPCPAAPQAALLEVPDLPVPEPVFGVCPGGICGGQGLCPPGLVPEPNGRCCRPGSVALPDGRCCPPGSRPHEGRCGCPEGQRLPNGNCCPPGSHLQANGRCGRCPPGTHVEENGRCGSCPRGTQLKADGKCGGRCPGGAAILANGTCGPAAGGCTPPMVGTPPNCRCPRGSSAGACAPKREKLHCPAGNIERLGRCAIIPCARGMVRTGGVCRPQAVHTRVQRFIARKSNAHAAHTRVRRFIARKSNAHAVHTRAQRFIARRTGGRKRK